MIVPTAEQTMVRASMPRRRHDACRCLFAVCVWSAVLSLVPVCIAQQLIEGIHGARLIQWPINGQITSMAIGDDGDVVVGGLTALDLGAGQLGFAPILWSLQESGAVQPTTLPPLAATSVHDTGRVNAVSRNGRWAGGWTPSSAAQAGTRWDVNDSTIRYPIGLDVVDTHGLLTVAWSWVAAVSDDGTSFGVAVEQDNANEYGFVQTPGEELATILPSLMTSRGTSGNLHPSSASRDGTIIVGEVPRADAMPHAAFWRSGEEFAQPFFEDDLLQ